MKQKAMVRAVCLLLAVLMVGGVLIGALSTFASAADDSSNEITTRIVKTGIASAKSPEMTFYDIDGNMIGTFSGNSSSPLVGFDSAKMIYKDENGEMIEENYSRVDVQLYLYDRKLSANMISKIPASSYYIKYTMGTSTGSVFANKIQVHEGNTDRLYYDVLFENVAFRDSNQMKIATTYQTSTIKNSKRVLKTNTATGTISISKAKLDNQISNTTIKKTTSNNTNTSPGYEDGNGGYFENTTNKTTTEGNPDTGTDTGNNNNNNNTGSDNNTDSDNNTGSEDNKPPVQTPDPTTSIPTPYLVIDKYSTGESSQVVAGQSFPLSISCKNTSTNVNLENIVMKISTAEGLQIADATNIFYVPQLGKSGTFTKELIISVLPNALAKANNVDVSFTYEYLVENTRHKGEMSQQISVSTVQQDRFSADPIRDIMEGAVGEEMYITAKYANKSRGEIFNLSATILGNFPDSEKIQHVGNVAAGVSGEIEFTITPDVAGDIKGEISYSYEDVMGNSKKVSVPFQTKVAEASVPEMGGMAGMAGMNDVELDENGNPIDPNATVPTMAAFLEKLKDPNSKELWMVVGGAIILVMIVVVVTIRKRKAAAEFEDDDETK